MMISAFSSNLRRRAAHDAPPATPPTMMTFMSALVISIRTESLRRSTLRFRFNPLPPGAPPHILLMCPRPAFDMDQPLPHGHSIYSNEGPGSFVGTCCINARSERCWSLRLSRGTATPVIFEVFRMAELARTHGPCDRWMCRGRKRLNEAREAQIPWKKWGPYLSERQWGTVREDYSEDGNAWNYFTHDQARSRAYKWGRGWPRRPVRRQATAVERSQQAHDFPPA